MLLQLQKYASYKVLQQIASRCYFLAIIFRSINIVEAIFTYLAQYLVSTVSIYFKFYTDISMGFDNFIGRMTFSNFYLTIFVNSFS